MSHDESRIEVRPSMLKNLMADVSSGAFRIPQFQREFVWSKSKTIELFDSIYREYPIGSFFIWRAGREHNDLFRHSIELDIPPIKPDDDVSFILDGQQRITSLYVSLNGMVVRGADYQHICFDLQEEKFTDRRPDDRRYVAVCDLWGERALDILEQIDSGFKPAYKKCWSVLQTYPISIVVVRDKDLGAVCKIFQRINQSGKRLDRFDLISAMTFTKDFDLREHFKTDVQQKLEKRGFGRLSPALITQLIALMKKGSCRESDEFGLTADDIKDAWPKAVESILLATDTLRKGMGVINIRYLPYYAILALLAYYFATSGNRALPAEHSDFVQEWFWKASFGKHYGSGGATRIGRDRELFDILINGDKPALRISVNLTVEDLVGIRMTSRGSAVRNAFLCMLATRNPVHLVNNLNLDLVAGGISDFTSTEKHHIFPKGFLTKEGPAGAEVHALPNFCFLPGELNRRISDSKPSVYFAEFENENSRLKEAAATHLISLDPSSGLLADDYLEFLGTRAKLILEETERLCGEILRPREGERKTTVERIENGLRECISDVMSEGVGEGWWKSNVQQAVRENVEKRIADFVHKHPDVKPEELSHTRKKLDYCNVMDYLTIIENGANWGFFESIFRRKSDLQHYLEAFSEYRNVVMHGRDMTDLVRMAGETAMIWLENVLPEGLSSVDVEIEAEYIEAE